MIATSTPRTTAKTQANWTIDLKSWARDDWKFGQAMINGTAYAIELDSIDKCGNEVWMVMKMDPTGHYFVTLKKHGKIGGAGYHRTALACTCPAGRIGKPCKHCKGLEILIDQSEADDFANF